MPPTDVDTENLLLSCRYGDLDDVQEFVKEFGAQPLAETRDENENCVLHMICGNGHLDVLDYLLPIVPTSLLAAQNSAKSTPLHWAALNSHLPIMQRLVEFPGGPGIDLIDIKNTAGRSPLGEAELAGWEEGAKWLVQMMKLDADVQEGDAEEEGGDKVHDIEVEIEDAEGQVAKMTISGSGGGEKNST
ncbi:cytoplasmic protein [Collybia nuda]|uniref:Cytoplasmic protein n=1 Tax=Collybia nuda TaxID=64659 RepID=A0A9P5Y6G1_9AGAR|nr:cytoplasmic protein [Collybia nuda]